MPHGMCYLWEPELLGLHVVSDTVIALSYFAIPPALLVLVLRTRRVLEPEDGNGDSLRLPYEWAFLAFGIFIVACGTTHVLNVLTVWNPIYWWSGTAKVVTALASLGTAVALPPLVPRATAAFRRLALADARAAELEVANRQLELSRERFRSAFEHAPIGMALVGTDGRFIRVNDSLCAILDYDEEALLDLTFQEITHPDDLDADLELLKELAEGRSEEYSLRKRYFDRSGDLVWIDLTVTTVRDSDGAPQFYISQIEDITEEREAQLALNDHVVELRRSNEELERFAYVASHDLQEPLRMVASYTELLGRRYEGQLDERADRYIHFAVDGARRMQTLINDLLTYSRVGRAELAFEPVDLEALVEEQLQSFQLRMAESEAVVTRDPLPTVTGDRGQLGQLVQNLLSNALKFHGEAPPRIHLSCHEEADHWHLAVRDEGLGIEPTYHDRIFGLFQRLHHRGDFEGTGLGLAICARIAHAHGGTIRVESEPGSGSTFHVALPKAPTPPRPATLPEAL